MGELACARDRAFEDVLGSFDRRIQRRKDVNLNSMTFRKPSYHASVKLVDISMSGCRLLDHRGEFSSGDYLTFSLDGMVVVEGIVRWARGQHCGVEFLAPLPGALIEALG